MSISIKNMAVHQLINNDSEEVTLQLRPEPLVASNLEETLAELLHKQVTSAKSKSFAFFSEGSATLELLEKHRANEGEFHETSVAMAENFHSNLTRYPFAEEGFLVICEYESLATRYMTIALIPHDMTMKIEDNLELSTTRHIDVTKIQLLSRIDLTSLETDKESNRYITFKNVRASQKIKDFFLDFMDAEIGLDAKSQNLMLLQAVDDYCVDNNVEKDDEHLIKNAVRDYAKGVENCNDEIEIKELSDEMPSLESGISFLDYTKENGYDLEDSFPAQTKQLKGLTRYVGAGGGVKIEFDAILLGERIHYDPETDKLTLVGIPPNLKDALTRRAAKA